MNWKPIETAPKDGTLIDVWVVEKFVLHKERETGKRIANAFYGEGLKYMHSSAESFDGWAYSEFPYTHQIERPLSGGECFITHWMSLPDPPKIDSTIPFPIPEDTDGLMKKGI